MKRDHDERGMLNEILPDPRAAGDARRGNPRERAREHLKRVIAAATGIALAPGLALGDASTPNGKKGDKPDGGKKQTQKKPPEPPPDRGYLVVDALPPPPPRNDSEPGWLVVQSKARGARIFVDGKDTGQKTPSARLKLPPGAHVVQIKLGERASDHVSVTVLPGESAIELLELVDAPKPAPPPKQDEPKLPPLK